MVNVSRFCGGNNFIICRIKLSVSDILHNTALEQPCILKHHSEKLSKLAPVEVRYVIPVNQYPSAVKLIEAHKQFDNGCFSCSRRTDYSYLLSLSDACAEIVDYYLFGGVAETNVFKRYITGNIKRCYISGIA